MDTNAYSVLGRWGLASSSRLLRVACCPDKDLVALISRLGGHDRLSLWKIQGSRTWEVDVSLEGAEATQVVDIAWSPNGQSIAVAHVHSSITLHSIQDGHRELTLTIDPTLTTGVEGSRQLSRLWWFRDKRTAPLSSIPDIFKRCDIVTGSAHSILRALPPLDKVQPDSHIVTATDIFAFQGSQTSSTAQTTAPTPIAKWPVLSADTTASVAQDMSQKFDPAVISEEVDQSNVNSLLVASDTHGRLFCFLDGTFPMGTISLLAGATVVSLLRHPLKPCLYAHVALPGLSESNTTDLLPTIIQVPQLNQRHLRDLARLSTTARDLLWYSLRVMKSMRRVWFGSDNVSGAREIGPKWVRALETKQREQFGQEDPNPILDLTCLLLTGKASEALSDFLGSGEQTSERGIQKWETTITDALAELRDSAEKRLAPACQRLTLILEELSGWSALPNYAPFALNTSDINHCLSLCQTSIVISSWLAAICRRELARVKEFLVWLRSETIHASSTAESIHPAHDILEVNNYFMSGLVVCQIDRWFIGPVPQFTLSTMSEGNLPETLEHAYTMTRDPKQIEWQTDTIQNDYGHLDRNLDALFHELANVYARIFDQASKAVSRSAVVSYGLDERQLLRTDTGRSTLTDQSIPTERVVVQDKGWLQYFVMRAQTNRSLVFVVKLQATVEEVVASPKLAISLLSCFIPEDTGTDVEIVDVDFFDDESVVVIYRPASQGAFITTIRYIDLEYQEWMTGEYVRLPAREDLVLEAIEHWKQGKLIPVRVPIKRCRALGGCKQGSVSLAVNGRTGRRVACVLDSTGTSIETFDLEGDGDDMEVEQEQFEVDADEDVAS